MNNYLSILTNFGCHFQCPYCVTKKHGIQIPATTVHSLDGLDDAVKSIGANIISVSGGGDPLHNYYEHTDFYRRLFAYCKENSIPLEMHTSYIHSLFPYGQCYRVVYHLRHPADIFLVWRYGREKVRVVLVVDQPFSNTMIDQLATYVKNSPHIDELSFRQMIDENYQPAYYSHEYLKAGHGKDWYYIEQGDYNTYYVDGKLSNQFKSFKGEKETNEH